MHRVFIYCCVWGVTELKRSIFTRCHSHSGRIINTQTHSHTYWVRALCCVWPHCVHADAHIQFPARCPAHGGDVEPQSLLVNIPRFHSVLVAAHLPHASCRPADCFAFDEEHIYNAF